MLEIVKTHLMFRKPVRLGKGHDKSVPTKTVIKDERKFPMTHSFTLGFTSLDEEITLDNLPVEGTIATLLS